ncbi:MAG: RNA methyltransferase [Candidatus Cloacimonetes bacterium]|jgi:23S rRNA (guanosine2251-2'-O)-methyltransferase|nr:RNA methyltransferase [Candidatus Cloacimonadota bacterium]
MKFTKDNFLGFNHMKQGKKLIELIAKIDTCWQDEPLRIELLKEFQTYLTYMKCEIGKDITRSSKREFLALAVPIEQEFGKNLKDDEFIILKNDKHLKERVTIPLYLILDDLRSAFNVGSIFRSAECFGVSQIYLCGYTPTPENKKVQKTAMGTDEYVKWSSNSSTEEVVTDLKKDGFTIYAVETTSNAKDLSKTDFKKQCALILGNEALGISEETLKLADEIVQIPLSGWKNSLNVGVCTAICCYEISRQWK